jgi:hypothetical protein
MRRTVKFKLQKKDMMKNGHGNHHTHLPCHVVRPPRTPERGNTSKLKCNQIWGGGRPASARWRTFDRPTSRSDQSPARSPFNIIIRWSSVTRALSRILTRVASVAGAMENLQIAGAQSFGDAHRGRICVRVFTGGSVRACCEYLRSTV